MNIDLQILIAKANMLLEKRDLPEYMVYGKRLGGSPWRVCRVSYQSYEPDRAKAAVAALRAGFVPVPVCPRFHEASVDLDWWNSDRLTPAKLRNHWRAHPADEIGFLLERCDGPKDAERLLMLENRSSILRRNR
jgi:hypothetical protein